MIGNKLLIAFEGVKASGKTTQCEKLVSYYSNKGYKCLNLKFIIMLKELYKEFEDSELVDKKIQEYFMGLKNDSELEFIVIDRYIHTLKYILRLNHSDTKAYRSLMESLLGWLPRPDILFYISINEESAASRMVLRNRTPEKFEQKDDLMTSIRIFPHVLDSDYHEIYKLNGLESTDYLHNLIIQKVNVTISDKKIY